MDFVRRSRKRQYARQLKIRHRHGPAAATIEPIDATSAG